MGDGTRARSGDRRPLTARPTGRRHRGDDDSLRPAVPRASSAVVARCCPRRIHPCWWYREGRTGSARARYRYRVRNTSSLGGGSPTNNRVRQAGRARLDEPRRTRDGRRYGCLLYTSDAADEEDSVDLGGRRIIKKKKTEKKKNK